MRINYIQPLNNSKRLHHSTGQRLQRTPDNRITWCDRKGVHDNTQGCLEYSLQYTHPRQTLPQGDCTISQMLTRTFRR